MILCIILSSFIIFKVIELIELYYDYNQYIKHTIISNYANATYKDFKRYFNEEIFKLGYDRTFIHNIDVFINQKTIMFYGKRMKLSFIDWLKAMRDVNKQISKLTQIEESKRVWEKK